MKTSYKELSELFHLKNERQIKANLKNKLRVINDDNIEIEDLELQKLIERFRASEEVLEIQDVCEQYGITREQLLILIKEEKVSHFKLLNEKGSKFLFFKSELDEEKEFLLVHYRRKDRFKHVEFYKVLLEYLLNDDKIDKRDRDVFLKYFTKDNQIEDIATEFDLTSTRVLQIVNDIHSKLIEAAQKIVQHIPSNKNPDIKNIIIPKILLEKIDNLDLSIRIKNVLKEESHENLKSFFDIAETPRKWMRFRNFGKNSADELESFLLKHNIKRNFIQNTHYKF